MEHQERFLAAYDEHADRLFRHAYFRVSDRDTALDLVQDAFTKAWDYLARGNEIDEYKPFLYRTLHNLIVDEYRKRRTVSLDAALEEEGVDEGRFDELVVQAHQDLVIRWEADELKELIALLPETYRDIVVMRYVDELMPAEIAELTGLTVNVVSVRIHRGVKHLKEQLATRTPTHPHEK